MEHSQTNHQATAVRLLAMAAAAVLVCGLPTPALADADSAAIEELNREWLEAYRAGDLDRLMEFYAEDAVLTLNKQPALVGPEAIRAFFAPRLAALDLAMEVETEEIQVYGDVAHLMALFWLTGQPKAGGPGFSVAGRSLLLYRRTPDGWRIWRDIDQETPDAVREAAPDDS